MKILEINLSNSSALTDISRRQWVLLITISCVRSIHSCLTSFEPFGNVHNWLHNRGKWSITLTMIKPTCVLVLAKNFQMNCTPTTSLFLTGCPSCTLYTCLYSVHLYWWKRQMWHQVHHVQASENAGERTTLALETMETVTQSRE